MRGRLLILVLLAPGCITEARLDDEWELIEEELAELDLAVEATLPQDGVIGVGRRGRPYVIFNRPLSGAEADALGDMDILDVQRDITQTAPVEVEFDRAGAWFDLDQLSRNLDYRLSVPAPLAQRDDVEVLVSTDIPRGPAFEVSGATGSALTTWGARAADAAQVNGFFNDMHPLWVLRVQGMGAGLPARVDIGMAPGDRGELVLDITQAWGFATWFQGVEVDADGAFEHTQERVFLPLYIGGEAHSAAILHLDEPTVSGRIVRDEAGRATRIDDFAVRGVVGTRWLRRMAQGVRPWPDAVGLAEPDVDTNGNGVPDAMSFGMEAQPLRVDDPGLIDD